MIKKILIVDDNPRDVHLSILTIRTDGYSFRQATSGEEAMEIASRERPDLILMDIQMPKLNGLNATRILRQVPDYYNIPIIEVSGYTQERDKETILKAGCDTFLPKPINTRKLHRLVKERRPLNALSYI